MKICEAIPKDISYLISDGSITSEDFSAKSSDFFRLVEKSVENKVTLVQIREKQLSALHILELAKTAVQIALNSNTKILVNDRADIALAAGADGVHLTSRAIPTDVVRRICPKDFIIGVSTHTIAEAEIASALGADFITFGPVFATPDKERYGQPVGLDKLAEVCAKLKPFPVIALGGIDGTNYRKVLQIGAAGFAAIRFLNDPANLKLLSNFDLVRELSDN